MKYLNDYRIFESKMEISAICKKYNICNYTINDDESIDVDGYVNLNGIVGTERLPLKFNKVSGFFDCSYNKLTSLEGSPEYVGAGFYCAFNNSLTSLEGCPEYVNGDVYVVKNSLKSLKGPKYIKQSFKVSDNKITSLEGCPEYIGGSFELSGNPIYCITRYFIDRVNKNNLIELFNYYDIIQDMNVIYDRLEYFFELINVKLSDGILEDIKERGGYNIIY